jgi:hypothetical protein
LSVSYDTPQLPPGLYPLVSIHCHGDFGAYASAQDKWDETHRPGVHIIIGKVHLEPPEMHLEAVVDGVRFRIHERAVLQGYRKRNPKVPQAWVDRVKVKIVGSGTTSDHHEDNSTTGVDYRSGQRGSKYGDQYSGRDGQQSENDSQV